MKTLELVIIIGEQCIIFRTPESGMDHLNKSLTEAVQSNDLFAFNGMAFARGEAIQGWYYRDPMPSTSDAMQRIAAAAEKNLNNPGDEWKDRP